jgi:16S rRNA (cytidine1402-2'-O)-methyltransferase
MATALIATLYVVATPIGNLSDLSARAIQTLQTVHAICVEDKRTSRPLLDHFGISAELLAVHEHNEVQASSAVIELLVQSKNVALISDAGTPGISDPGSRLVAAVRDAGFQVCPIPGPSAMAAVMSVCGFDKHPANTPTWFEGFLPSKVGDRNRRLDELAKVQAHVLFYEAPHRIVDSARALAAQLGPDRQCVLGREITKKFEQWYSGTLSELAVWLEADPDHQRGEFVIAVSAPVIQTDATTLASLQISQTDLVEVLLEHVSQSEATKIAIELAKRSGDAMGACKAQWSKSAVYEMALKLKR